MEKERIEVYLEVLACPKCKGDLEFKRMIKKGESEPREGFFCKRCHLFYPIEEDIPNMLPEEALNLLDEYS